MKRMFVLLLAAGMLPLAQAQVASSGPAQAPPLVIQIPAEGPVQASPQNVHMRSDGRCMDARPGDTVHYELTIQSAESARAIVADLQLRPGGHARLDTSGGLPAPDFRSLGGGGVGLRDPQQPTLYHFVFRVPTEILGGVYRAVGVLVTTDTSAPMHDADRVNVSRRTRDQIAHYCLNVISSFGVENGRPEVTDFQPGPVDPRRLPAPKQ